MSSHFVPIIGLCGNAGVGKDTAGSYISQVYNGICVAQADPMKRFVSKVFGFTDDQLWGPSENRNAVDPRTVTDKLKISKNFEDTVHNRNELLDEVVPPRGNNPGTPYTRLYINYDGTTALLRLKRWFEGLYRNTLCNDIPVSPRLVLQTLGTEWGRKTFKEMWSEFAIKTCQKLLSGGFSYTPQAGLIEDQNQLGWDFAVITDVRFRNEVINIRMAGGVALKIERSTDATAVEAGGVKGHASEKELGGIPVHFYNQILNNNGTIADFTGRIDSVMAYSFGV